MKAQAITFFEGLRGRLEPRLQRRGLMFLGPDERVGIEGPRDEDVASGDLRQVIDPDSFGLDLQDHFPAEGVADQAFIQMRQRVEREAVRQFSRAHPEKTPGLALDQGVDLAGDISDVHIDRDQRDVQIILQDAVGAVERAVGLRVQVPVPATKVIRPRGGAGLQESPLEIRKPEFFLAGGERCFFDIPEKSVLVCDKRDRDAAEGPQDAPGQGRASGICIQINMIDLRDLFLSHAVL